MRLKNGSRTLLKSHSYNDKAFSRLCKPVMHVLRPTCNSLEFIFDVFDNSLKHLLVWTRLHSL